MVKTGRFADIDTNLRPKTEAELAIYQESVNQVYELFLEKVAQYRHLTQARVREIAQGRIWSGQEAADIGLVDSIGGLKAATIYAAERAKLGTDWQLEEYPQQNRLEIEIVERLLATEALQSSGKSDPITTELLKIQRELATFQSFDDPRGIYARLPFNLDFE